MRLPLNNTNSSPNLIGFGSAASEATGKESAETEVEADEHEEEAEQGTEENGDEDEDGEDREKME